MEEKNQTEDTVKNDREEQKKVKPQRNWRNVVEQIGHKGVVQNIPFLLYVTFLCVLYITNTNRAILLTKEIKTNEIKLKELDWEHKDVQSRLMYQTTETKLTPKSAEIGLKPLSIPAYEIKYKK